MSLCIRYCILLNINCSVHAMTSDKGETSDLFSWIFNTPFKVKQKKLLCLLRLNSSSHFDTLMTVVFKATPESCGNNIKNWLTRYEFIQIWYFSTWTYFIFFELILCHNLNTMTTIKAYLNLADHLWWSFLCPNIANNYKLFTIFPKNLYCWFLTLF